MAGDPQSPQGLTAVTAGKQLPGQVSGERSRNIAGKILQELYQLLKIIFIPIYSFAISVAPFRLYFHKTVKFINTH